MWSRKLKIIFEYDGIWHFKDIHWQLENKQIKDKMTEEFALKNGYKLIRIADDKNITLEQIENIVYNTLDNVIKIGDNY